MNYNKKLVFILIGILLFVAVGCSSGGNEAQQTGEPDASENSAAVETVEMYKIANAIGDYGLPTPFTHSKRGPGYLRTTLIYDTLIWFDHDGYTGLLAENWEWGKDYKTIDFKLRKNVTWHDGKSFTADDVVFTFAYFNEHIYEWLDSSIVSEAEKIDDYTVRIHLKDTSATFMIRVACGIPILPKHIYETISEPKLVNEIEKVVGTGPYKLADYSKEHGTYLFEANENYYLGKPYVQKISYIKIGNQMIPAAIMDGTVNAGAIPGEMIEQCEAKGLTVVSNFHEWNCKLMFNHTEKPFSDMEFRQAVAYAVDREKLVQISQRGFASVGQPGLLPPENPWYFADTEKYLLSLEKSKQLIEQLGYEMKDGFYYNNKKPLGFELVTWSEYSRDAEMIQMDLEKVGIKVDIKILEKGTVDTKAIEQDYDAIISGHGVAGDPVVIQSVVLSKYNNSAQYHQNDRLTDLLNKQVVEMDEVKRKEMVKEIQKIYAEELPALTLYYPEDYFAHDGQVDLSYTPGGISIGIPLCENKLAFVKK